MWEDLYIHPASPQESLRALAFYDALIDGMQEAEYPLRWVKGVYPCLADLEAAIAECSLYLAESSGRVVGAFILNHKQGEGYAAVDWAYPAAEDRVAVLHLLATAPDLQGRGIGGRLLAAARDLAAAKGDRVMRLDTLTWNVPGQKLYERFGFRWAGDVELDYATTGKIPFRMYEIRVIAENRLR